MLTIDPLTFFRLKNEEGRNLESTILSNIIFVLQPANDEMIASFACTREIDGAVYNRIFLHIRDS